VGDYEAEGTKTSFTLPREEKASDIATHNLFFRCSDCCVHVHTVRRNVKPLQRKCAHSNVFLWYPLFPRRLLRSWHERFVQRHNLAKLLCPKNGHYLRKKTVITIQWRAEVWWCPGRLRDWMPPTKA